MNKIAESSERMFEAMQSMHRVTSHHAMALVTCVAIKRGSDTKQSDILKLLGVSIHRFSAWTMRNFGMHPSTLIAALLNKKTVTVLETSSDESAKRAIEFISGNKS